MVGIGVKSLYKRFYIKALSPHARLVAIYLAHSLNLFRGLNDSSLVWIILSLFLILTELVATSIVAVFLGIGALVTGCLLYLGCNQHTKPYNY